MTDLHPACPSAFYLISATVIYNDSSLIQKCTCVLTSWEESKEEGKIFRKLWLNDFWARRRKAKPNRNDTLALPCSKQFRQEEFFLLHTTALEEKGLRKRLGEGCPSPRDSGGDEELVGHPVAGCFPEDAQGCGCNLHTQPRPPWSSAPITKSRGWITTF